MHAMTMSIPAILAQRPTAASLLADITAGDTEIRQRAIEQSVLVGTPLIVPLGRVMAGSDPAAGKAALEALRCVAHHCARPGAGAERATAARELLKLTEAAFPRHVRSEALMLLGCIGTAEHAPALARLLKDPQVQTDALMALQRIPGGGVERALRGAVAGAAPSLRDAIGLALQARSRRFRRR